MNGSEVDGRGWKVARGMAVSRCVCRAVSARTGLEGRARRGGRMVGVCINGVAITRCGEGRYKRIRCWYAEGEGAQAVKGGRGVACCALHFWYAR